MMSKGLEALKDIRITLGGFYKNDFSGTKLTKEFNIIEKELKALEIIIALAVFIIHQDIGGSYELETIVDSISLTKEEYDLLKEVLS